MRALLLCGLWLLALIVPLGGPARAVAVLVDGRTNRAVAPPEFFLAAASGDVDALSCYLRAGVSVDSPIAVPAPAEIGGHIDPHSLSGLVLREGAGTALMLAVASKQPAAAKALVDAGANREARTRRGTRPLDLAADLADVAAMQLILGVAPNSDASRLNILVNLETQRAVLKRDDIELYSTDISSGKDKKPTPRGTFVVTQKYETWRSTLYHSASMPYFLRLSCSAVGLHMGYVTGRPESHGCIRLPGGAAKRFYKLVPLGTVVTIR